MSNHSKKRLTGVLKLPAKTRAKIAEKLLESLEEEPSVDSAIDEAERRWQAYKAGKMKGIPLKDVFPDLIKLCAILDKSRQQIAERKCLEHEEFWAKVEGSKRHGRAMK